MDVDLRKLYSLKTLDLEAEVIIPESYYQKIDIIKMSPVKVKGRIFINVSEEIELDINLQGTFILPCSITLEELGYDFQTNLKQIIDENQQNNEISLALLDILWENIVLEVPIKVVKEGIHTDNIKGDGWELEASND